MNYLHFDKKGKKLIIWNIFILFINMLLCILIFYDINVHNNIVLIEIYYMGVLL